ncbi:origin recognition complex subunit 4 C-terminus-domain-containing protein [Scleroderma yunnanense]
MILDCVEITTPRFVSKTRDTASPAIASIKGILQRPPVTPSRRGNSVASSAIPKSAPLPLTPSKGRAPASTQKSFPPLFRPVPGTPTTPGRSPKKLSPSKDIDVQSSPQRPKRLPQVLPLHLRPYLRLQQRAILAYLKSSSNLFVDDDGDDGQLSTNAVTYRQLQDLLLGSVIRGEGNSCLLMGPRGSGKTSIIEQAIASLPKKPIVIRLSGHMQQNDRLGLREVAQQLSLQTGKSFLTGINENTDEDHNPSLDSGISTSLPPPSHLPALISLLPTLSRPTIVILDAFDLFAQHARQSLLYCLLDTVQSCRIGQDSNGLAVIGVTSRIDTTNLLEKRVKSRFSGRVLRTAPAVSSRHWINLSRKVLCTPVDTGEEEWEYMWRLAVEKFLDDQKVTEAMADTFTLTRDVRLLRQALIGVVTGLRHTSPFPSLSEMNCALTAQCRPQYSDLHLLPYPSICLLIAAMHAQTAGHDIMTFEMLHEAFKEQVRASAAAPVQVEGGSIGMTKCTRPGFERLLATGMFLSVAGPSVNVAPEFVRCRCAVAREAVKKAVDAIGQTSLKKWFYKAS